MKIKSRTGAFSDYKTRDNVEKRQQKNTTETARDKKAPRDNKQVAAAARPN